jgi:ATP-dependent DNA helicase RecQ
VIDVLRGQQRDKVQKFGHDQLSTFGIGAAYSDNQWRSIFRQLVVRGFLSVEHGQFGALRLTQSARGLLRGETTLQLREEPDKPKKRRASVRIELELEDEDLMDALRETRREIASAHGIPPYVIFHDATLVDMIQQRPQRVEDLLQISGIGQAKLEKYGQIFLDIIHQFQPAR